MNRNLLSPEDIQFKYIKGIGMADEHHTLLRDDQYGIQWEQITKKKNQVEFGKPKNYYFIDGVEKEYTDIQKLCDDWNELKNFDDPDNEIVWVKIIRKKVTPQ